MKFIALNGEEARRILAPLAGNSKTDTSCGVCDIADFLGGGQGWLLVDGVGLHLLAFVIEKIERANGRELVISAALQLTPRGGLTEAILPEIERIFGADCDLMTVHTKRSGLVRKLEKSGYAEAAKVMQKRITK